MADVLALGPWRTNAELIRDGVVPLGYLAADMRVLDPTWGLGKFWTLWRPHDPHDLVGSDLDPTLSPTGTAVDFRHLPHDDDSFDACVLDGPYKLNGTSAHPSDERYGAHVPANREHRHQMIREGIVEGLRVVHPGGHLLVKCQDQVEGGRYRWQTHIFAAHAEAHGARLADAFYLRGRRGQPKGRRQVHARSSFSTLLVLELPRRRRPRRSAPADTTGAA